MLCILLQKDHIIVNRNEVFDIIFVRVNILINFLNKPQEIELSLTVKLHTIRIELSNP